jgi:hypothetical protein
MKFSLTVDSPREAGYATSMFRALQSAMIAEPAPVVRSKTETVSVGDVSQSVHTDFASAMNTLSESAEHAPHAAEIAQEVATAVAAGADPATALAAATEKKKRGRKSQADKDAEAAAKKASEENALRPGDALKGVSAQSLAAALEGMPVVFSGDGVQLRVAPGTPQEEIDAMRANIEAQVVVKEDHTVAAQTKLDELFPQATTTEVKPVAESNVTPITKVAAPIAGMDDDLASLFRKKTPEPEPVVVPQGASRFAAMTGPQLLKEFVAHLNGEGGMFWGRNVLKRYSLEALDDLTDAQMREVLENPAQFNSPV